MRSLVLLFAAGAVAAFIVLAFFVFPISNLIRQEITEEASVVIKQDATCVVEGSDSRPRTIENCAYNLGDRVMISYNDGTLPILKHSPVE
jgi:hypothetical protein